VQVEVLKVQEEIFPNKTQFDIRKVP